MNIEVKSEVKSKVKNELDILTWKTKGNKSHAFFTSVFTSLFTSHVRGTFHRVDNLHFFFGNPKENLTGTFCGAPQGALSPRRAAFRRPLNSHCHRDYCLHIQGRFQWPEWISGMAGMAEPEGPE